MAHHRPHSTSPLACGAAALLTSLILSFVSMPEARASQPPTRETITHTIPADGDVVPPETRIIFFSAGSRTLSRRMTVRSKGGVQSTGEEEFVPWAWDYEGMRLFTPTVPLEAGEYVAGMTSDPTGQFDVEFEVDDSLKPQPPEGTVDVAWYHETHEEWAGSTAYASTESHEISVELPGEEPAYFDMRFVSRDGTEHPYILTGDYAGTLRSYKVRDIECIRVAPAAFDGSLGEVVEICQPHKCNHFAEKHRAYALATTDWDRINDCSCNGYYVEPGSDDDANTCDLDDSDASNDTESDDHRRP